MKLKYLNYIAEDHNTQLHLQYPKELVSLTICKVKVLNLSNCVQLENFYCEHIKLDKDDV